VATKRKRKASMPGMLIWSRGYERRFIAAVEELHESVRSLTLAAQSTDRLHTALLSVVQRLEAQAAAAAARPARKRRTKAEQRQLDAAAGEVAEDLRDGDQELAQLERSFGPVVEVMEDRSNGAR